MPLIVSISVCHLDLLDTMERYDNIEGYVWYIALGKVVKA